MSCQAKINREKIPPGIFISASFFALAALPHAARRPRLVQQQDARWLNRPLY
jgi:hypothetical protein